VAEVPPEADTVAVARHTDAVGSAVVAMVLHEEAVTVVGTAVEEEARHIARTKSLPDSCSAHLLFSSMVLKIL